MPRSPAVTCTACAYAWNSAAMAEGLRLIGSCPRCNGELAFHSATPVSCAPSVVSADPHTVMGLPRISGF